MRRFAHNIKQDFKHIYYIGFFRQTYMTLIDVSLVNKV